MNASVVNAHRHHLGDPIPKTTHQIIKLANCNLKGSTHYKSTLKLHHHVSKVQLKRCISTITKATADVAPPPTSSFHTLEDGMRMELLSLPGKGPEASSRPPLLFIHGSYHGAWCFAEQFMPFFSAAGYDCYALSLRGQGGSDRGDLKISGTLTSHAADLASVVGALPRPPVLLAHSFGGLLAEKYLSLKYTQGGEQPDVAGVALLCSVPPSGNKDIVVRITKRNFFTSMKITWAFVGKSFAKDLNACRETFFSSDIPESDLKRYQEKLAACSPVRLLDLGSINKELPLPPLGSASRKLPAFVGGGETDLVVDKEAVQESADWLGVEPVMWKGVAHDCMLDTRWKDVAVSILNWLEKNY